MPLIPFPGTDGTLKDPHPVLTYNTPSSFHDELSLSTIMPRGLGDFNSVNASSILAADQQHIKQLLATCTSSISLACAVCAVYWFCMMRRNFRRDLVLLLIVGGSWKSLWFLAFSAVTFTQGPIATETKFCQASGYMLQVGFEMCDMAVLFMSMHMYLQIFPPSRFTLLGHDGLYRLRRWVVAAWFILPNISAALAFLNPRSAYLAQGGFCTLPLRPFWYRLALFWIPRYLIWLYIVFVAITITRYVGSEFKVFGQEKDSSTSQFTHGSSSDGAEATDPLDTSCKRSSRLLDPSGDEHTEDESPGPQRDDVESSGTTDPKTQSGTSRPSNGSRRHSLFNWTYEPGDLDMNENLFASQNKSTPSSRRGSRQVAAGILFDDFAAPPNFDFSSHRASNASQGSVKSSNGVLFGNTPVLASIVEGLPSNVKSNAPPHSANKTLKLRRRAIQRQLRLLFIYPCVYMLLWVIPFVLNCMNYSDHYAQHPVFALNAVALACMTSMTAVDVLVFCWRERPWKHIPGSDGTVIGSFMFWRFCFGGNWAAQRRASRAPSALPETTDDRDEKSNSRTGFLASLKWWSAGRKNSSPRSSEAGAALGHGRPSHRRTFSGGSDRRHRDAEQAQKRLAMEREEYESKRRSLQERRTSVVCQQQPAGRKDWFDRQMNEALIEDTAVSTNEKKEVQ